MALEERVFYLWEKQTEFGHIGVRKVTIILKDGVEIAKNYHRQVPILAPDSDITNELPEVQAVANAVWTKEVKDKWKEEKEKREK